LVQRIRLINSSKLIFCMKKQSKLTNVSAGVLVLAISFLPSLALARDTGESDEGVSVSVNANAREDGAGVSVNSTTTLGSQRDDAEDSQNDTRGSEDSVDRSSERQSNNASRESDEDETEIEVDQDSADSASSTVDAPEDVSSHGELRSFLNHMVKSDERIADVHVSSTSVDTHYDMPAKFLWAIPTNITAEVSVGSDGSVTVTYPWYAFLFAKHDSDLAAQLEQAASSTAAGTSTSFSASTQAHLLNLIFSILKSSQ
jgi:hypothetical protein